jgi:membrane protein
VSVSSRDRLRHGVSAARHLYHGSWAEDFLGRLKGLDAVNWTTLFGAYLLLSAVPLMIVLGSLANERIDDDLSRHLGLNRGGAEVVRNLFRNKPTHAFIPIATSLIISFVGTVAVVGSLQLIYERTYQVEHRKYRDIPRYCIWVIVLVGALIVEATIGAHVHRTAGRVVHAFFASIGVALFFLWTMHFLLAGRVPWRVLIRPAIVTAVCWIALEQFSAIYFSSTVSSDSKLYGSIGVVFSLLTWFILISTVIVLGVAGGAAWQDSVDRRRALRRPR